MGCHEKIRIQKGAVCMSIVGIVDEYINLLQPFFETELYAEYVDNYDFANIILDGENQNLILTVYREDSLRLYWCNECFIFDRYRSHLTSSDTFGEIVYEEKIDINTLPNIITELIGCLKGTTFINKEETVIGKTTFGYDDIKNYKIMAKLETNTTKENFTCGNLFFQFC